MSQLSNGPIFIWSCSILITDFPNIFNIALGFVISRFCGTWSIWLWKSYVCCWRLCSTSSWLPTKSRFATTFAPWGVNTGQFMEVTVLVTVMDILTRTMPMMWILKVWRGLWVFLRIPFPIWCRSRTNLWPWLLHLREESLAIKKGRFWGLPAPLWKRMLFSLSIKVYL